MGKSSVDEIRERFDNDVERFSTLSIGQTTTVDAVLAMDLIAQSALLVNPDARHVLDVGCGAGNYTLKLLQRQYDLDVTLVDLSKPMLDRARQRIGEVTEGEVTTMQGDIRELDIGEERYDIILAAAVLHHLRDESQWLHVFKKLYLSLKPGGSVWVFDLRQGVLWQDGTPFSSADVVATKGRSPTCTSTFASIPPTSALRLTRWSARTKPMARIHSTASSSDTSASSTG